MTGEVKEISRTIELVLGIIGGIFGLLGGVFAVLFGAIASDEIIIMGMSAILASIVGIAGSIYVTRNPRRGGVTLIISAIWLLISISLFGLIGAIFFGISGLLALLR